MNANLVKNKESWEVVSDKFFGWCSLPSWGPYDAARERDFFNKIGGSSFIEFCCGSGHSLQFLLESGAKQVFGIDISENQITSSEKQLASYETSKYKLFNMPIESFPYDDFSSCFDYAYSIYGLGWSVNVEKQLLDIYKILKPGGKLVFSWEHPLFKIIKGFESASNSNSYYKEGTFFIDSWAKGNGAYIQHFKIESWVKMIVKAGFILEEIVEPENGGIDLIEERSPSLAKYYSREIKDRIPMSIIFICRK